MYNQQNSAFGTTFTGTSQFRGQQQQQQYQPVGMVQSQYSQNQNQNQSYGIAGQAQNANSFHTANYRGNQAGHDNYLRADSQNPSQFGAGSIGSSFGITGQQYGGANTFQNTNSFHSANYRGNQAGHDNYLRADSQNPSQSGIGFGGAAQSQYQPQTNYQIQNQNQFQNQSQSYGMVGQAQNANSFHTANYRGNQAGHDNYLRADSTQPSSSFSGFSGNSGYRF
jgi:hypothetical protein